MDNQQVVIGIVLTTMLLLLLVAGIFITIFLAGRQKMKLELTYEKELRLVETEVGERMMEQFARELHDNIGHALTCMTVTMENKKLDLPELEPVFEPIEQYLHAASTQLRMLSRSLNTDYVTNLGLKNSIALETDRLKQMGKFNVKVLLGPEEVIMDDNRKLMAFRIFQEMIQNTLRHSNAKNISIEYESTEKFMLIVADDGKGFDMDELMRSGKASGLMNMKKRSRMAGFDCHIETKPGSGCKYSLSTNNN